MFYHGTLKFYLEGENGPDIITHIFSTRHFSGKMRSTEEGKLKWVSKGKIPYDKMWEDDPYWFPAMFRGKRFDGKFYFDAANKRMLKGELKIK